jgi:uncharacterized protein (DUF302 family)
MTHEIPADAHDTWSVSVDRHEFLSLRPFNEVVEGVRAGLIVFLELDLGAVLDLDPQASGYKILRIIAGDPVTMGRMTRSTPAAGAFAPITVLVYEASDGVRIRYDTLTSAVGLELTDDAAAIARKLDEAVLDLLSSVI